jgi:chromosome segregation ATPase
MNSEERIFDELKGIKKDVRDSLQDRAVLNEKVDRLERAIIQLTESITELTNVKNDIESIQKRLEMGNGRFDAIDKRLEAIEEAPMKRDAALVKDLKNKIRNGLIAAVSAVVVGVIIAAFLGYFHK